MKKLIGALAAVGLTAVMNVGGALAQTQCSVWLVESSRFMKVPFGAFMPDRAFVPGSTNPNNNINTVDLPVNVVVIKCGQELILYDSGWKQQDYLKMTGSEHWVALPQQLKDLGFSADQVTKIVIGPCAWTPMPCAIFAKSTFGSSIVVPTCAREMPRLCRLAMRCRCMTSW